MKKNKPVPISLSFADRALTFCENLTLIFIALRLAGAIDWSVWKVFMPMIIAFGIPTLIGIILGILKAVLKSKEDEE